MAKVSLRNYNKEITTLIDQGQTDEAIGHCLHILKVFPKHLETYRLLGKAYLEAQRYNDAGDIFSRVLMSVPNDFVSHAGMSMIADEKSKPNEAIWHMQRAFEAQPSNAAVQGELQRLYGRRDGVEPPKISMTSGALANVYVQGELYAQAIAEIMSVEAQDPGRMDMQVLLANAYFRSGQRVEASQTASNLLAKSPYCLDANRILVEILPETSRAENTQTYRHRINSLDPYAAFVKGSVFNTDEVPDAAINLERLDWHPGAPAEMAGGWDDSGGIELDKDEQPDWLKKDDNARDLEPASAMGAAAEEEDIPDFMRAAGWGDSSGEETPASFFDSADPEPVAAENDDEEIVQAEMPEWMKMMAPSGADLAAAEEKTLENDEKNEMGDDMASDDWINDLLDDNKDEEKKPAVPPESKTGLDDELIGSLGTSADDQDAAMNWLESLAANQGAKPEELITDPNARTESAPEWVEKAKDVASDAPAAADDDDLAWLNDAVEEEPAIEKAEDIPSWLQDAKEESPAAAAAEESLVSDSAIGELGASADDQDAAMNWLESLAANQGAKPEELITDPNARTEAAPEWVEQAKEVSATPPAAEASDELAWINDVAEETPVAEVVDDTPDWLKDAEDESAIEAASDIPSWLQDAKEEPVIPEAPVTEKTDELAWINEVAEETPPAAKADDVPDWLQDKVETATPPPAAPQAEETLIADSTIGELGASADDQDSAMNWLESLAANQGAKPEELITDPNARTEAAPEWVEKAKDVSASAPTPTPVLVVEEAPAPPEPELPAEFAQEASIEAAEETPSWITEPEASEPAQPVADAIPATKDDMPSWLSDMGNEESEAQVEEKTDEALPDWMQAEEEKPSPQPTQSVEWQPAETTPEPVVAPTPAPEPAPVVEDKTFGSVAAKLAKGGALPRRGETQKKEAAPVQKEVAPVKAPPKKKKVARRMNTTMLRDITLMSAQAALREGNISAALGEYGKMVKKKRLLDEIIYDLREALDDYPIDVSIWQMLGDAYMRAGQLQEAIDAYTKAEKLLR